MMTADVVLSSDEYLFFEGDPAAFYILLEGTIELSQFVVGIDTCLAPIKRENFLARCCY